MRIDAYDIVILAEEEQEEGMKSAKKRKAPNGKVKVTWDHVLPRYCIIFFGDLPRKRLIAESSLTLPPTSPL